MKVNKCYANSLDNCSGKLSKEHVISESILANQMKADLDGKTRNVSKGSMVVRILCEGHNNKLSLADAEIKALTTFWVEDSARYSPIYNTSILHNHSLPVSYQVNGKNFENWLIKTAINYKYFMDGPSKINELPLTFLVERLFNNKDFEYPFGLFEYDLDKVIAPLFPGQIYFDYHKMYPSGEIYGVTINLQGHVYFLSFSINHVHEVLKAGVSFNNRRYYLRSEYPEKFTDDYYTPTLMYHPNGLRTFQINDTGELVERSLILLNW